MKSTYGGTLGGLFALLDEAWAGGGLPERITRRPWYAKPVEYGLFGAEVPADVPEAAGIPAAAGVPDECSAGRLLGLLAGPENRPPDGAAALLWELSAEAYGAFFYAWMSELPVEAAALRFAVKVLAAGRAAADGDGWSTTEEARRAACDAAADRLDKDCETVRQAAYKAYRELDRLRGLLRFTAAEGPGGAAVYHARCAPDHFVLPGLAGHFHLRFGSGGAWAVTDERRGLTLYCPAEGVPAIDFAGAGTAAATADPLESLWKHYHKTINNEARSNPALQKRFMPGRYWKYVTEMESFSK